MQQLLRQYRQNTSQATHAPHHVPSFFDIVLRKGDVFWSPNEFD